MVVRPPRRSRMTHTGSRGTSSRRRALGWSPGVTSAPIAKSAGRPIAMPLRSQSAPASSEWLGLRAQRRYRGSDGGTGSERRACGPHNRPPSGQFPGSTRAARRNRLPFVVVVDDPIQQLKPSASLALPNARELRGPLVLVLDLPSIKGNVMDVSPANCGADHKCQGECESGDSSHAKHQ